MSSPLRYLLVLGLLAAYFVATAGPARAGCGDYIHILPNADQPPPAKTPCPCRGAECAPASPAVPTAPPTAPNDGPPDAVLVPETTATRQDASLGRALTWTRPLALPNDLFRPPRR